MNLRDFPRPPNDNGLGIHLGLDLTDRKVKADLDRCLYMGIKWAVICHESQDLVIRAAKTLWQSGIMPILRFYVQINKLVQWGHWTKKAADTLGFSPYIQIYNEPGDDREWKNGKVPTNWLDIFAHKWHEAANAVALAGGLPGLQVLGTKELQFVLDIGGAEYDGAFHNRAWFCPHNYGQKFPPEHYNEGEGKSLGVLSFLDFAPVFQERAGYIPPFICGEGGWFNPGPPIIDRFLGDLTLEQHAGWTRELFLSFYDGMLPNCDDTPDYLFAICPWILSGCGMQGWYSWWTLKKTIEAVKEISGFVRQNGGVSGTPNNGDLPNNWRVVSEWMTEDEAWNELAELERAGFHTYQLEERGEEDAGE